MSATEGYTRYEPGHWELTDVLSFGPLEATRQVNGVTVTAVPVIDDYGDPDVVYTFTDGSADSSFTVSPYWFEDQLYGDAYFSVGVNIVHAPDDDSAPGGVTASLAVADITLGEGDYGFLPTVRCHFTKANGEEIPRFSVRENMTFSSGSEGKYYIDPHAKFPVGEEDGQKIYALLSVQDDLDGGTRVFIAWEYTWVEQPEEIEVPTQYGPIEFIDPIDPEPSAQRSPVILIVPVLLAAAVVILLVRRHKRKK